MSRCSQAAPSLSLTRASGSRHGVVRAPEAGGCRGYRLDNCSSQRQLSAAGRAQSERLGQWFAARQLRPSAVLSSQWCRCKDTASLAFGRVTEWTALNSTFDQSAKQPAQTSQLRERLRQIQPGQFEVWLTHQVNMTDLCREYPAMGEAFVVDGAARLASRMAFG